LSTYLDNERGGDVEGQVGNYADIRLLRPVLPQLTREDLLHVEVHDVSNVDIHPKTVKQFSNITEIQRSKEFATETGAGYEETAKNY
jgi:hypothetical protein